MRHGGCLSAFKPGLHLTFRLWGTRDFALLALLLGGTAAVMAGGFHVPGSEFDEGRAVTFPDRLLHGAVPYRDFESFYGPANTYLTAAAFDVFGSSMYVERAIGFVIALVIVFALYVLGRRFGRLAAFGSGLVGATLLAGVVVATSQHEAQAFALLGLAASMTAATRPTGGAQRVVFRRRLSGRGGPALSPGVLARRRAFGRSTPALGQVAAKCRPIHPRLLDGAPAVRSGRSPGGRPEASPQLQGPPGNGQRPETAVSEPHIRRRATVRSSPSSRPLRWS